MEIHSIPTLKVEVIYIYILYSLPLLGQGQNGSSKWRSTPYFLDGWLSLKDCPKQRSTPLLLDGQVKWRSRCPCVSILEIHSISPNDVGMDLQNINGSPFSVIAVSKTKMDLHFQIDQNPILRWISIFNVIEIQIMDGSPFLVLWRSKIKMDLQFSKL